MEYLNFIFAYNGWVYMQCEIWNTELHLTTNVDQNDELEYTTETHITYTPCYKYVKKIIQMKKEVKIEDFISKEELDKMTEKEREIYEKVFLLNKQRLQELTNTLNMINEVKDKIENS